jgi:hypothetical protein
LLKGGSALDLVAGRHDRLRLVFGQRIQLRCLLPPGPGSLSSATCARISSPPLWRTTRTVLEVILILEVPFIVTP